MMARPDADSFLADLVYFYGSAGLGQMGAGVHLSRPAFEALVVEALDSLPAPFLEALENVEVVVESEPTRSQLRAAGVRSGTLLGLYEGVPLTDRSSAYGMVVPDRITLFRRPIASMAENDDAARRIVRETVIHEIAHHFGISDERLDELGVP